MLLLEERPGTPKKDADKRTGGGGGGGRIHTKRHGNRRKESEAEAQRIDAEQWIQEEENWKRSKQ